MDNAMIQKKRFTFGECLRGSFERPRGRVESLAFDALFVFGMATTMVFLINMGVRPFVLGDPEPLIECVQDSLKMLPEMLVVALAARLIYADRVSAWVLRCFIAPHCTGIAASILMVTTNVILMAPAMCACAVLVSGAPPQAILSAFSTVLPYAALAGFIISMAFIRPLIMMVFSNVIVPRLRMRQ